MTWRTLKNGKEEAILSGFHLRLDAATGKGELQPGGWYGSFEADGPGTIEEHRAALIQAGYDKLHRMLTEYRTQALEMGVVVAPPTFIE